MGDSTLPNAEVPMFLCIALFTSVFAMAAFGVQWLYTPTIVPNPGLAAYKAPINIKVALPASADFASAESSALLAAAESNSSADATKKPGKIEASVGERNRKQARRGGDSRKSKTASRAGRENRRILWGYAADPY